MNLLMRFFLLFIGMISFLCGIGQTDTPGVSGKVIQQKDSLVKQFSRIDSATKTGDTLLLADSNQAGLSAQMPPSLPLIDTTTYRKYYTHPFLPLSGTPLFMISDFRERRTLDDMFYLLMGVVLLLAFVRAVFPRYIKNLFVLFLQTSLRQKQTKDQLLQDNLDSLFVNFLFIVTTSIYGALVIRNNDWLDFPFWHIVFFGAALLTVVYFGKFIFLQFSGWIFNSKEAAGNYTFTVFLVNKVLGIILVPFLFLMAFAKPGLREIAFTVSIGCMIILLLYRYIVSFATIRNTLKVNALHFFLYLCAVEIVPLMLIYKLMTDYIGGRF